MNNTKFAQAFYYISIVVLTLSALGIVWRLIIFPPCTQIGNACVIEGWDVAGLAGTVLGVAATVLAILGAVAVAAWWTSLNDRVTDQVKKLYDTQKEEINKNVDDLLKDQQKKIEKDVQQSQTRVDSFKESLNDFEATITESFAALGPLLAEPIAQRAMAANKYPTFPFYMTSSYLILIKQEGELPQLEREIATYQESINVIQSEIDSNVDLYYSVPRSKMEDRKKTLLSYLDGFNTFSRIGSILEDWHRTVFWWKAAEDNQPKTPSLKPEDFDNVQKEFDLYSTRMEKAEQDFDKIKSDTQSLLSRIEDLLQ